MKYFLDLDGVIVDSINECYIVSKNVYFNNKEFNYNEERYKELFFKHRGIVGPANQFEYLHELIEKKIVNEKFDINFNFDLIKSNNNLLFEKNFFTYRQDLIDKDEIKWIAMNPLTDFGTKLANRKDISVYIVTTKNMAATKILLNYYNIHYKKVFSNQEVKKFGNKGQLIKNFAKENNFNNIIFVDDLIDHLDTAKKLGIKCKFADWGYGINTDYDIFDYSFLS